MVVVIKLEDGAFGKEALSDALQSLGRRSFVENDGQTLTYRSGDYTITMSGEIAAEAGSEPRGWDLNNTQINEMTFSSGGRTLTLSGLAMDLREIYTSRSIDDLRDFTDFSRRQDYTIVGSDAADVIRGSLQGSSIITGRDGDDRLVSLGTNDKVLAGNGDDIIVLKGDGARAKGEAGYDQFVLKEVDTEARILDFDPGQDRIDLGAILDDLVGRDIGSKMRFIGDDAFNDDRFEIRSEVHQSDGGTVTTVELNLRGDEFLLVELSGKVNLDLSDFMF